MRGTWTKAGRVGGGLGSGGRVALVAAAVSVGACVRPPVQLAPERVQREIAAPPERVTRAAVAVFAEHNIPVATVDPEVGLVQSQPVTVQGRWNGTLVHERFDCGKDVVGESNAYSNPVTFTVGVLAQPADAGSVAKISFSGSTHNEVARAMAYTNPMAAALGSSVRCSMKPAFAALILDEVQSRATGQPARSTP